MATKKPIKRIKKAPPPIPAELSNLIERPVSPSSLPKDRHAFNRDSKWDPVIRFLQSSNPYPDWTPLKNAPKAGTSTTTYLKNRFGKPYIKVISAARRSPAERKKNPNYIPGFEAMTVQGKAYIRINPSPSEPQE